eukprot:TRINITY_DN25021_c0_g1_i1.p1 TRINITY_DN25021_c0_g1~~TRINITY_DN25021_c0_g1_i1.p1  ORF type:complete len:159 (-),score=48.52 TRINITY_DN25021_c0_g1_i1:64-540(-)
MEQIDRLEQREHMEEIENVYNVEAINNMRERTFMVEKQDVAEERRNMKQSRKKLFAFNETLPDNVDVKTKEKPGMSTTFQLSYKHQNGPKPRKSKDNSLHSVFGPCVETSRPRNKPLPVNPVTGHVLGCGLQARKEARPPPVLSARRSHGGGAHSPLW